MTITIEQWRDYLERRMHESADQTSAEWAAADPYAVGSDEYKQHTQTARIARTRSQLYGELVGILDRGELPE